MKTDYSVDFEEMMNIDDLCSHLKIEKKKAYNLCKLDTFPAIKIGNTYSIPKRLYLKWLGENVGKKVYL